MLSAEPDPYDASVAHQAAAIVLREFDDVEAAVRELGAALSFARRTGSPQRIADVLASRGVALVYSGRTAGGLAAFDEALTVASGALAGRILARRGMAFIALGRYPAAMADLRQAVTVLRRAGDDLWTARAVSARGVVHLALGSTSRADADLAAAEELFATTNQQLELVYTIHNRAFCAYSVGDLPAALAYFDDAATRYRQLNVFVPALSLDRCAVLLAAGLTADALIEANTAVQAIEQGGGQATAKAELLLMAASCALATGSPRTAMIGARLALRLFRSQQRDWWQARAGAVLCQAKYADGQVSVGLLHESERAVAALDAAGSRETALAHLLAGRVAADLRRGREAEAHFAAAARSRLRGPAIARASGWLGEALAAQAAGDQRRLFAACRNGLSALEEHRRTFGASELRAQVTSHGAGLAALALRQAAGARQPRLLLAWSERCRATTLAVPAVRPGPDSAINADLAALRQVARLLDVSRRSGLTAAVRAEQARLEREQLRLERLVRGRALGARGTHRKPGAIDIADLLDQLGDATLIEIVEVDGLVQVLVCGSGRVRQFAAGQVGDAAQAAAFACFALRRMARSRPGHEQDSATAIVRSAGPKLSGALLGPAARHLGEGPVVVVPPARLHAIPWSLIPALADRAVSVAPSAAAWLQARAAARPARRRVTLVRGPGLIADGAEIPDIAGLYDDVTVLAGGDAAASKVLAALDGAWLGHIAAHGTFRGDSPMFSSLRMHDGPLTVYDFEQLERAPYQLILPSCDSGVLAPAGAGELIGLVSSLLPLGTAGIVAAIVPLNDVAVAPVMVELHRHLREGRTLAESMRIVRSTAGADPVRQATAASLIALGAS
ncbi:MAG TPA: CHAT domain-containing protein [Streptosporangiaceae bacterium]|nr:CHAT domain-containing protein [Streptosporangiaceae bacterium]